MRECRIEITEFEFLSILSLTIDVEINKHACAIITGLISDENAAAYREKLTQDVWTRISAIDENKQSTDVMNGIVAGFSMESFPHRTILTLKIMSGTWLMDCETHFRTFQNPNLSYEQVMEVIGKGYTDSYFAGISAIKSPIGGLLLQYLETDWEFIRRIASHFGSYITPSVAHTGAVYYVGAMETSGVVKTPINTPFTANKRVGDFMRNSSSGLGSLSEYDYLEFKFQTRDIYNLWDQISLDCYTGYICKIHSEYIGNELIHTYFLRSEQGMAFIPAFNNRHTGCSFDAVIREVKQDVVRIDVTDDENVSQDETIWFPYSTVYSTPDGPGWYCMPEIGDQVRLHIPDEREQNAYVISAVHKGNSPDRQNPDHKSIKTIYGKELLMTPELIKLTNNNGLSIELDDGAGIKIISDKEILIQAASNITITSEEASMTVSGSDSVNMVQGGASVRLDDDIAFTGAKFRIE